MRKIIEAKAAILSYREAIHGGAAQRILIEAIQHNSGIDTPIKDLREELSTAIQKGDVGNTAALTINLRRQNAMNLEEAASLMQLVNNRASRLDNINIKREEVEKGTTLIDRIRPRRWLLEAQQADDEYDKRFTKARAHRWKRYASLLQQTSQAA